MRMNVKGALLLMAVATLVTVVNWRYTVVMIGTLLGAYWVNELCKELRKEQSNAQI